jgi:hypothetical protein
VVYSSAATATNITTMDYNNYYADGSGNIPVLGYVSSTQHTTLPAMQAAFGGNLNSVNIAPVFVSPNDLHLVPQQNALLDNLGTPVAGITMDIDGQLRSITTPDIGADEFSAPTCTTASSGTLSSTAFSLCAGNALLVSAAGVSSGATTVYQWMQSAAPGGPYSPVSGGNGANSTNYQSAGLSAGTIYYVLQVTCGSASLTSVSNEATVTVNPVPSASISSNAPICQGQSLNLNGATDFGTVFNWTGPAGFNSSQQNETIANAQASATGVYTLMISTANCSSTPVTLAVLINTVSVGITGPMMVCSGNTVTLTATGNGTSFAWSNLATGNSIVVSPTSTTVYSVTATSAAGCTVATNHTLSVTNPTITGFGALACGTPSASGTLSATAFGPVSWYDSPTSTVSLGTGNTFVTPAVSTNTTFFAESNSNIIDSLLTNMAGSLQFPSLMFDVVAQNNIEVTGFDANFNGTGTSTVEIWYRPGSFVGFETSNAGWTLAATSTVQALGVGNLATIPAVISVNMASGQTYGFYLAVVGGTNFRYSSGTSLGAVWAQNSDVQILEGKSGSGYYNVTTSPRAFNGELRYKKPGCTSPRIPVTLTVSPTPTVNAATSSSLVCPNATVNLTATGAATYTWSNGTNGQAIIASPSVNTTYTVTGTDSGCSASATVDVNVHNVVPVTLTAGQTTVCTSGPVVSLNGSPIGGSYSGTNVNGNLFTPGSSAGTFTPVYTFIDTNTGCSDSASVAIVVDPCTGVGNSVKLNGLSVYPNPNHGLFTVSLRNGLEKKVELTDLTGRIVLSKCTPDDSIEVNISELTNGIYFVKIDSNGISETYKIVKQ